MPLVPTKQFAAEVKALLPSAPAISETVTRETVRRDKCSFLRMLAEAVNTRARLL